MLKHHNTGNSLQSAEELSSLPSFHEACCPLGRKTRPLVKKKEKKKVTKGADSPVARTGYSMRAAAVEFQKGKLPGSKQPARAHWLLLPTPTVEQTLPDGKLRLLTLELFVGRTKLRRTPKVSRCRSTTASARWASLPATAASHPVDSKRKAHPFPENHSETHSAPVTSTLSFLRCCSSVNAA
ncbi:hypothetical protein HPB51_021971 [Rhipicephalus microplus]|uniref:Uncharacterized protein n=1 Tax=Rhipicephalus microplus TaxID=6941 RepID=A0A9J6EP55_RHIMP|nr:hypothetical protein HPB51_021971 [Rhipicephalus microplus]